jgi:hypothetical protein
MIANNAPLVKSIGKYVPGVARTEYIKKVRTSPGEAEFGEAIKHLGWGKTETSGAHGPSYYPGILFAIDVETGRVLQWRTDQADSEILWADDSTFYYRRINELYKVGIVQGANGPVIGPATLVLKDDALLDVHASFRGK